MKLILTLLSLGLAGGSAMGQDITTQLLNQQALQKIKKPNAGGSLAIPDMQPRNPAGHLIDETTYHLGPGDLLAVHLGGPATYQVDPLGNVSFPDVPPVRVSGLTLDRAKAAMKKSLARSYDTSKVYISLAAANTFKISVFGEVANPGLKTVTSYTRAEELIAASGGFTRYAIRDRILVAHMDGALDTVWIGRNFREPAGSREPDIRFGDKVLIGKVDFATPHCIVRSGNEMYFHQLDGESSLGDIWLQINSYVQAATPSQARLVRGGRSQGMDPKEIAAYVPQSGDTVEFRKESDNIFVGGAVMRPGMYDYIPNFSASDYVFFAGLTPQSAESNTFHLYREGKILDEDEVLKTGVKPGDRIFLERSKVDSTRDYLAIIASLASIVISSVTLYFTAR